MPRRLLSTSLGLALVLAFALSGPALAQRKKADEGPNSIVSSLGDSKQPIAIDADRLDVFDKEGRAIFVGNVVAVQGDTTMRCAQMTVHYDSHRNSGAAGGKSAAAGPLNQNSAITKIICKGPVTIKTKEQVASGDTATFDRVANKFYLTGNASLSDAKGNVTVGQQVVYDVGTSIATVTGGRPRAIIVQGEGDSSPKAKQKPKGQ